MNVQKFLSDEGVAFEVVEHYPTYDAQHLSQAVHVSGDHVAKTVLLRVLGEKPHAVAVLPASRQVDLAKASAALGAEAKLATESEVAECCPDCERGALPPFGSRYSLTTLVDERLSHEENLVFEGNTHSEAIKMKFADFKRLESPTVAPIVNEV